VVRIYHEDPWAGIKEASEKLGSTDYRKTEWDAGASSEEKTTIPEKSLPQGV
jgi:hypothetical protein